LRRNCLLKYVVERKVEEGIKVKGRKGIRLKQLLGGLKETRGYWKLKEKAPARFVWGTRF
jgi:hypothetical protein